MVLSGLWHGAAWNFIAWGLLHGLFYIPLMLLGNRRERSETVAERRILPSFGELAAMLGTFTIVMAAFVVFRAGSLSRAAAYFDRFSEGPFYDAGQWHGQYLVGLAFIGGLVIIEWLQRHGQHGLAIARLPVPLRWTCYLTVCLAILLLGNFGAVDFLYFQF